MNKFQLLNDGLIVNKISKKVKNAFDLIINCKKNQHKLTKKMIEDDFEKHNQKLFKCNNLIYSVFALYWNWEWGSGRWEFD